jgi:acyl-coenzyme A thioesterase PaaI-like protein
MKDDINQKQPGSRDCFVCGVENPFGLKLDFFTTGPGEVSVNTILSENYQGYPGVVHGGIVACIVDEVLGRVHMGDSLNNPRFMVTAKMSIHYRQPVPTNKPIRIVGSVLTSKKRTATSKAAIFDQDGTVLVEAEALLVDVPKDKFDLDALGWQVYPDRELES